MTVVAYLQCKFRNCSIQDIKHKDLVFMLSITGSKDVRFLESM